MAALALAACQNQPIPTAAPVVAPTATATSAPALPPTSAPAAPTPMKDDMPKDPPRAGSLQAEPADYTEAAAAIQAVRAKLQETTKVTVAEIEVTKVEKVRWPEGVLPMAAGATPRPDTYVQGYRIQILAANVAYEGRCDLFGGRIVIVKLP